MKPDANGSSETASAKRATRFECARLLSEKTVRVTCVACRVLHPPHAVGALLLVSEQDRSGGVFVQHLEGLKNRRHQALEQRCELPLRMRDVEGVRDGIRYGNDLRRVSRAGQERQTEIFQRKFGVAVTSSLTKPTRVDQGTRTIQPGGDVRTVGRRNGAERRRHRHRHRRPGPPHAWATRHLRH